MGSENEPLCTLIGAACARLGLQHLLLTVHDASFPALAGDDIGRGSPYGRGAQQLLAFARGLGFNGLQLGPQGKTSLSDPSPYNAAQFARSEQSLDLAALRDDPETAGLLPQDLLERAIEQRPQGARERVAHAYAWRVVEDALQHAQRNFTRNPGAFGAVARELPHFARAQQHWLQADGLYEVLTELHGSDHFTHFSRARGELDARLYCPRPGEEAAALQRRQQLALHHSDRLARNALSQLLLDRQHRALRDTAARLGLQLWGDLQIGYAPRDLWRWKPVFLAGYRFGAPPSRTNPDGQPWDYPVLDPDQIAIPSPAGNRAGPAARLLGWRISHLLADFDGLRIDHPHGLVCPWVYRSDDPDPMRAVKAGARLRSSPNSAAHPELARFAIATQADLASPERAVLPYADDWVRELTEEQVSRYAALFEIVMEQVALHDRAATDIAAEVLSTCPYPLARVLARHGLGRFRVVQKADPDNAGDPYRSQFARPSDWIMLGTHDTRPIWRVVDSWVGSPLPAAWGRYLATRLAPDPSARPALAARLQADPTALTHALFADLFLGPARHICVFFPDLFGMTETYNNPGTIGEANWRLRVPPDFATLYERRRLAGHALDLAAALSTALQARSAGASGDEADLARALRARAAPRALLTT